MCKLLFTFSWLRNLNTLCLLYKNLTWAAWGWKYFCLHLYKQAGQGKPRTRTSGTWTWHIRDLICNCLCSLLGFDLHWRLGKNWIYPTIKQVFIPSNVAWLVLITFNCTIEQLKVSMWFRNTDFFENQWIFWLGFLIPLSCFVKQCWGWFFGESEHACRWIPDPHRHLPRLPSPSFYNGS